MIVVTVSKNNDDEATLFNIELKASKKSIPICQKTLGSAPPQHALQLRCPQSTNKLTSTSTTQRTHSVCTFSLSTQHGTYANLQPSGSTQWTRSPPLFCFQCTK